MPPILITKLIWDSWNTNHIAKHNVSVQEVEIALSDPKAVFLGTYNNRIMALGRAKKRLLAVVMSKNEKNAYYVVSARDMADKERKIYRKEVKV